MRKRVPAHGHPFLAIPLCSPDGRFVMIAAAPSHGVETVGIGWLNELRARLAQAR